MNDEIKRCFDCHDKDESEEKSNLHKFEETGEFAQMMDEVRTGGQTPMASPIQCRSMWMEEKMGSYHQTSKQLHHQMPRLPNNTMKENCMLVGRKTSTQYFDIGDSEDMGSKRLQEDIPDHGDQQDGAEHLGGTKGIRRSWDKGRNSF